MLAAVSWNCEIILATEPPFSGVDCWVRCRWPCGKGGMFGGTSLATSSTCDSSFSDIDSASCTTVKAWDTNNKLWWGVHSDPRLRTYDNSGEASVGDVLLPRNDDSDFAAGRSIPQNRDGFRLSFARHFDAVHFQKPIADLQSSVLHSCALESKTIRCLLLEKSAGLTFGIIFFM